MRAESSLLELCRVQLDIHEIKEIQKPRKIRLSYSLEFIAHVILEKQSGNVPKGTKKKQQEIYLRSPLHNEFSSWKKSIFHMCERHGLPQISQIYAEKDRLDRLSKWIC